MDTPHAAVVIEYEIRLGCHLQAGAAVWFDGLAMTNLADGGCLLTGPLADQAALHGVLARIRDLGLPLISAAPGKKDEP